MSLSIIHGIFGRVSDGGAAVSALQEAGFSPERLSIIGSDGDTFRQATACLESQVPDRLFVWLALAGALVGTAAGFLGIPGFPAREQYYLMFLPIMGAFCGTAVGTYSGMAIAGILRLDCPPASKANIQFGKVNDGDIAVSVRVQTEAEHREVTRVFEQNGASSVSIVFDSPPHNHIAAPELVREPLVVLSRSA